MIVRVVERIARQHHARETGIEGLFDQIGACQAFAALVPDAVVGLYPAGGLVAIDEVLAGAEKHHQVR